MLVYSVPFAAPPVGALRWTAPQPPAAWSGIRDATRLGKSCPQIVPFELQSEDCLYMNIYVPTVDRLPVNNGSSLSSLPVMIWMHGGTAYCLHLLIFM